MFKTPYGTDHDAESLALGTINREPSLTQQSQRDEADINVIVSRFGVTNQGPPAPLPPSLSEFEDVFDFQHAMNTIAAAKHSFMMLPAEIREAFGNDPHRFVNTVDAMVTDQDEERRQANLAVLRTMGLAVAPGPAVDKTTLGDLLAAIKAGQGPGDKQPTQGGTPAPSPSEGA